MKKTILINVGILIATGSLSGCSDVEPERAALVMQMDYAMCGACGGWFVQIDSVWYRADVAAPYNKEYMPVWIRFKKDESDGLKVWGGGGSIFLRSAAEHKGLRKFGAILTDRQVV